MENIEFHMKGTLLLQVKPYKSRQSSSWEEQSLFTFDEQLIWNEHFLVLFEIICCNLIFG